MKRITCLFLSFLILMLAVFPVMALNGPVLSLTPTLGVLSKGSEVSVTVNLKDCDKCKSLALVFDYDTDSIFEIVSGEWLLSGTILSGFDKTTTKAGTAAAAYMNETDVNGNIFVLKLKVKDSAPAGDTTITVTPTIKNGSQTISCSAATEKVKITNACNHTGGTATCKDKAICTVCHQPYGDYGTHSLTPHDRNEPDHYSAGNIQYWTCDVCNKYFSDAEGKTEIEEKDTVLAVIPHSYSETWKQNATQHWHECSVCHDKKDIADHTYSNACDTTCNVCGYIRTVGPHVYDNACDTTCNECGATRTITHSYELIWSKDGLQHWHECSVCHDKKDIANHRYNNACDTTCNDCGYIRTVGPHVYDNACDTTCNECGATRTITHSYQNTWSKDGLQHWHECSVCHDKTDVADHRYDNACDTTCNDCGYIRTVGPHVYDNACDTTCNECGATRTITHSYQNTWSKDGVQHWHECSVCHNKTDIASHSGGTATCSQQAVCSVCNASYGSLNSNNHVHTELRNAIPATTTHEGYTGDVYCFDCHRTVETGKTIPQINPYPDVDQSAWYVQAVNYVSSSGIFTGYTSGAKAGKFGVSDPIQRQDFLVALARYGNVNAASYSGNGGFRDVDAGSYYAFAVVWGANNGITSGYTSGPNAGKFGVGDYITREQLVTFMYRYAKYIGADTSVTTDAAYWRSKYSDFDSVSVFSQDAIIWALEKGVISGKTVNGKVCIAPQGNAQRCEVAQIFYNIDQKKVFG